MNGDDPDNLPHTNGKLVPLSGIVTTCAVFIVLALLMLYSLWAFWPLPVLDQKAGGGSRAEQHVDWLVWTFDLNREFLFFITVAVAGALGGLIHIIRSFTWYVGNRSYVWSWVPFYLLLPVVGALAGTVFYLVLRAGLFSPSTSVEQASPFGFAAIAILAGLFSPQAFEKLRELAANIFTESEKGTDHVPPQPSAGQPSPTDVPPNEPRADER